MSNVTTNHAASAALTVLRGINKDLGVVQHQVSSGYRIETASDDPTYWSMATTMRSDRSSLSTITDALGLGSSKVDTASTAMDTVVSLLTQIQSKLVSAKEEGTNKDAINSDIQQLKNQLQSVTQSASFSGENWLYNNSSAMPDTRSVIGGYTRGPNGQFYPENISIPSSNLVMIDSRDASKGLLTKAIDPGNGTGSQFYLLNANSSTPAGGTEIALSDSTSSQDLADMQSAVEKILSSLNTTASGLGIMQNQIDARSDYISKMMDSLDTTVGALVDTDMDEASTRQTAIGTQLNVATEAMNILNTSAGNILILLE